MKREQNIGLVGRKVIEVQLFAKDQVEEITINEDGSWIIVLKDSQEKPEPYLQFPRIHDCE